LKSIFLKDELLAVSNLENEGLKYLGNGKRKFLIIINEKENNQKNIEFLKKILNAKKITLEEDIFLLPINDAHLSIFQMKKEKPIEQVIFFGTEPTQLGLNINISNYQKAEINGLTLMKGDAISTIEKNESLKRSLWGCLKDWPILEI